MKKSTIPTIRKHIQPFEEDWNLLEKLYGPNSANQFGVGPAIRQIIHNHCQKVRLKQEQLLDKVES